jgi:glycosyltransferase involved in cell wall biosynthesis
VALPYLWAQRGRLRRPLVLDLDWTLEQQEALAPLYYGRPPKTGLRAALARAQERALWGAVTLFTPWSTWAAESLRGQGVPEERIRVLPPGVDLVEFRPRPELRAARPAGDDRLRLLFVGGDFVRKGGDLLLDVFRERFGARCQLDVVTRDAVAAPPGVRLHRAEVNSPLLRELYARADVFVLPTRAECFGLATVEAMACGLPVIVGDVGGVRDIVEDGRTGWLIPPTPEGLGAALERALAHREELPALGAAGRCVAERRFDGRRNDALLVEWLVELATGGARAGRPG